MAKTPRQVKQPKYAEKKKSPTANANTPNDKIGIDSAKPRDLPNHLDQNYTAEVKIPEKTEDGLDNRRGILGKRPDVQLLSEQFGKPNTFWTCAFYPNELETLLALAAHIDEVHQDCMTVN